MSPILRGLESAFLICIICIPFSTTLSPVFANPSHSLLGAFFDPGFGHYLKWNMSDCHPPSSWASNFLPAVFDTRDPSRALYNSNDTHVILWQLGKIKEAGLDFVAAYWQGRDSYGDRVLRKILSQIMPLSNNPNHDLKWAFEYEKERFANPSVEEIVGDLQYLKSAFTSDNILHIHHKIVLFVRAGGEDTAEYVQKWSEVRKIVDGFYFVLKVFPGSTTLVDATDSWYEFAPANRIQFDTYYWGYVSPGFSKYQDHTRRLSRDLNEFAAALQRLKETNTHFSLIETWNDWNEGTQVEPGFDAAGKSYGNSYIDLIRQIMKENMLPSQERLAILGSLFVTVAVLLVLLPIVFFKAKHGKNGAEGAQ